MAEEPEMGPSLSSGGLAWHVGEPGKRREGWSWEMELFVGNWRGPQEVDIPGAPQPPSHPHCLPHPPFWLCVAVHPWALWITREGWRLVSMFLTCSAQQLPPSDQRGALYLKEALSPRCSTPAENSAQKETSRCLAD